jgi:hypothetical protein
MLSKPSTRQDSFELPRAAVWVESAVCGAHGEGVALACAVGVGPVFEDGRCRAELAQAASVEDADAVGDGGGFVEVVCNE